MCVRVRACACVRVRACTCVHVCVHNATITNVVEHGMISTQNTNHGVVLAIAIKVKHKRDIYTYQRHNKGIAYRDHGTHK